MPQSSFPLGERETGWRQRIRRQSTFLRTINRQLELKDRTSLDGRRCPNPTFVALDDRMADGKAHTHSIGLGREQRFEDLFKVGWINPRSGVFNRHMHETSSGVLGSYLQHARLNRMHRIDGIHDEVQEDLL